MFPTMRCEALEMIQRLPPDATVEDVVQALNLLATVERGLRQINAGQVVSHEEAKRRFGR